MALRLITSYLLIGFWDGRRASQDGALKALVITALGGLALLVAVILLALGGGSDRLSGLDLIALKESPYFVPAMILALFAAFSKSAQLPFHLWLPTAMEAPTPVSAYLHSATMVKAGVILIAKFSALLAGTDFATAVLFFGLATMFWGSYLALRQTDLKALLAYSTVSQLGILVALYGSGDAFAATAQLVNHAAFKATLFLVVGIIDHETGSRDLRNLSGLGRRLPLTMLLAVPAALSMAGLPPFGGFISKELFFEGMLQQGSLPIDLVFTATSDPGPVVLPEHVKPGAWILDLGRPSDVHPTVRSVPGVHLVPGGVVRPPGEMRSSIDLHFGDGLVPACLAETMIMTATRGFDRASLGSTTRSADIDFYLREGAALGFEIVTRDDRVATFETAL